MLESELRRWLKTVWGSGLAWTEAARGGTVGLPDVSIPLGPERLPVELKVWERTTKGVRAEMRPSQIRFHRLEARDGRRTAILAAVPNGESFDLLAMPGHRCPTEPYPAPLLGFWLHDAVRVHSEIAKDWLVGTFAAKRFWRL